MSTPDRVSPPLSRHIFPIRDDVIRGTVRTFAGFDEEMLQAIRNLNVIQTTDGALSALLMGAVRPQLYEDTMSDAARMRYRVGVCVGGVIVRKSLQGIEKQYGHPVPVMIDYDRLGQSVAAVSPWPFLRADTNGNLPVNPAQVSQLELGTYVENPRTIANFRFLQNEWIANALTFMPNGQDPDTTENLITLGVKDTFDFNAALYGESAPQAV